MKPYISIISIHYNEEQVTTWFLDYWTKNLPSNYQLILVDNASKKDLTKDWAKAYPEVDLIRLEKNLGFAGGNNEGLKIAKGDFLFFLNNDAFITPQSINQMAEYLSQNPKIGILSPYVLDLNTDFTKTNRIQYAGCTRMHSITGRTQTLHEGTDWDSTKFPIYQPTGYIHGAAMLISAKVLKEVGPMDDSYFLYYEELDWSETIRKAGYGIGIYNTTVWHMTSASIGKTSPLKLFYHTRNRMRIMKKFKSFAQYGLFMIYYSTLVIPKLLLKHWKNKPSRQAIWKAFTASAN